MSASDEVTAVRDAHKFDEDRLHKYLQMQIPNFGCTMTVRRFEGGQSNPTFMVEAANKRYVVRKKPPGELLASAHQVDREYRIRTALADTDVPVPQTFCLCEDDTIIGTSFYVMDCVEGRIFRDPQAPSIDPTQRAAIYDSMNANMAKLHAVDYEAVGWGILAVRVIISSDRLDVGPNNIMRHKPPTCRK
jgi:aminoglycoside phosphotransferase (APT) family kinase protein